MRWGILFSVLGVFCIPTVSNSASVTYCDNGYVAELVQVSINPENPEPGSTYETSVSFWWPDQQPPVSEGSQELRVTLSGFPVVNTESPLCDNVPCPIVNGWNNHTWKGGVPSGVSGSVVVYENWKTKDGKSIVCFDVGYTI